MKADKGKPGKASSFQGVVSDKPSQEFHLTPMGWVSGTSREFGTVRGDPVERPPDTIETWLEELVIPYLYCADVYSWTMIWQDASLSEPERKKVRNQFPKPSDGFP